MAGKFQVLFLGDTKDLERSMAAIQSTAGTFADKTRRRQRSLTGFSRAVAGGLLAGTVAAGHAAMEAIGAAEDSEVSTAKLQGQMKAQGVSWKAHAGQIDQVVQKVSRLSGLDDEDLQDGFTAILRVTGSVQRSLRLVGLVADIARAKNLGTAQAAQLVARVAGGNVSILKRYGIVIDKTASSSEALAILQRKFQGQALAYGNTTQGAYDKFQVARENLNEAVGSKLLPAFTSLLLTGVRLVNDTAKVIESLSHATVATTGWVGKTAGPIIDGIKGITGAIIREAGWIFGKIYDGAKTFATIPADAARLLIGRFATMVRNVFRGAFAGIGGAMVEGLIKGLDVKAIVGFLIHELGGVTKLAGGLISDLAKLFGGGGKPGTAFPTGTVGPTVDGAKLVMKVIAGKHLPYTYGGGHGRLGVGNPGFDCSGYVSVALGIIGAIRSPMAVREPMASALQRGDGKRVTVGIRGSSGKNAHTMIKLDNQYFESGGGHGPAQVAGWDGAFEHFHPRGFADGGIITTNRPYGFLAGEKGPERVTMTPLDKFRGLVIRRPVIRSINDANALAARIAFHATA